MMKSPKRYSGFLYKLSSAFTPPGDTDYATIPSSEIYTLPLDQGIFPLERVNQMILGWQLHSMPTASSHVDITPFSARGFAFDQGGVGQSLFGYSSDAAANQPNGGSPYATALNLFSFDEFDTAANRMLQKNYTLRKTVADGTAAYGPLGLIYNLGTREPLPLAEGYIGFLVQTDGTNGTGRHTLTLDLRWA